MQTRWGDCVLFDRDLAIDRLHAGTPSEFKLKALPRDDPRMLLRPLGPWSMTVGESHSVSDWALALLFWSFFVLFPLHWIVTGRWWSAIVTLMLCGAMILLSRFAAMAASC